MQTGKQHQSLLLEMLPVSSSGKKNSWNKLQRYKLSVYLPGRKASAQFSYSHPKYNPDCNQKF